MTDRYELSRRKTLAGLATIGAAGAGAGLGTSALFSDTESLEGVVQAGSLDLEVTAEVVESVDNDYWDSLSLDASTADGEVVVALDVGDVKPGDWAIISFETVVGGNPGYVQARAGELTGYENGLTDPESDEEGTGGDPGRGNGELQEHLVAEFYGSHDESASGSSPRAALSDRFEAISEGSSLQETADALAEGSPFVDGNGDPIEVGTAGAERYLLLELPTDVGNVIQTDSIEFDLHFDAEQVRNNDDPFNGTD